MGNYDMTYPDKNTVVTSFTATDDADAVNKGRAYSTPRPNGEGNYYLWNLDTSPYKLVRTYSQGADTTDPNTMSENYADAHPDEAGTVVDENGNVVRTQTGKTPEDKKTEVKETEVKETEFKRLWKAYEPLWILMIAGFSSAVLGIILITWYKHGAPLPQGGA